MEKVIPKEEILADLSATRVDIVNLQLVITGLRGFISDSHGENRFLPFKAHLFLYEGLLREAHVLKEKMEVAYLKA